MGKKITYNIFLLALFLYSCANKNQINDQINNDNHLGVYIENEPIRGAGYTDSLGQMCVYRIITARIFNDTTIPINLLLNLPIRNIDLLPKSNKQFKVFLLPEMRSSETKNSMTPTSISFYNEFEKPKVLNKIIQPGESYTINLELFFNSNSSEGYTRAQMTLNSQGNKLSDTDTLIKPKNNRKHYSNILLNTSLESNATGIGTYSTTVLCGNLSLIN